jgi:hypothetical protein
MYLVSKFNYHLSHVDEEEEVIDDEEIQKDVLDKSVLANKECLNPEPIADRLQANADIPYTDVRDIRVCH